MVLFLKQDWKRRCKPTMTMTIPKGANVEAMAVVEDFIYLTCNKSPNIIQVVCNFYYCYISIYRKIIIIIMSGYTYLYTVY